MGDLDNATRQTYFRTSTSKSLVRRERSSEAEMDIGILRSRIRRSRELEKYYGLHVSHSRSQLNQMADRHRTDISLQKQAEEDAVERANLVEKLALRTQEAAQHERNFQQMAELAPCGKSMCVLWID
jgi:hypothetical protein